MRWVSPPALLIVTLALGACDSQQDKIAASRGLPPFDIRACVHEIRASTQIPPNGCLISPTGAYVLVMRPSGALDITAASQAAAGGKALWTTGSRSAKPDTALATFQSDGNLVVYDHQRPIWNTGSVGAIGDYDLKLSDIGNLTIANSAGKTVWSSGFSLAACATGLEAGSALPVGGCVASPSKTYALVMADAGSLDVAPVKPDGSLGAPIWTSGSRASAAHSASGAFQTDGNLVIYDQPGPRPIWNSMSNGPLGAYRLELSDAGEAEILDASGKTIWSSKTGRPGKA